METSKRDLIKENIAKSKTNLMIGLITLLSVVVLVSLIGWLVLKPAPQLIQGEVEADELRISSKLAGRIQEIRIEEGVFVHEGDTLGLISSPELYAKLEQAEAAQEAAQHRRQAAASAAHDRPV